MVINKKNKSNVVLSFDMGKASFGQFSPLKVPSGLNIDPGNLDATAIEHGEFDINLDMKVGEYSFSLLEDDPFVVLVNKPTVCHATIGVNRVWQKNKKTTVITGLDLEFSNPLVLDNVLTTLKQLPSIFDDRDIKIVREFLTNIGMSELLSSISALGKKVSDKMDEGLEFVSAVDDRLAKGLGFIKNNIVKGTSFIKHGITDGYHSLPQVFLTKVTGKPRLHNQMWEIEFAFSGEIAYSEMKIHPFNEVVLPHAIIPALFADLNKLISDDPLSSASFYQNRLDTKSHIIEFFRSITNISGDFNLEGNIPDTSMYFKFQDGAKIEGDLSSYETARLSGKFSGTTSEDNINFSVTDLNLRGTGGIIKSSMDIKLESLGEYSVVDTIIESLRESSWLGERCKLTIENEIKEQSRLKGMSLSIGYKHPYVRSQMHGQVNVNELEFSGKVSVESFPESQILEVKNIDLDYHISFNHPSSSLLEDGITTVTPKKIEGFLTGKIASSGNNNLSMESRGKVDFDIEANIFEEGIPEFDIKRGNIFSNFIGELDLHLFLDLRENAKQIMEMELSGSKGYINLIKGVVSTDNYLLSIPGGSLFDLEAKKVVLDASGEGFSEIFAGYYLKNKSPILSNNEKSVEIFVKELRAQSFILNIDKLGGLDITGNSGGLYDSHYFNALINPGAEPDKWVEIIKSPEAMEKVIASLSIFNEDYADFLEKLKDHALKVIDIFEKEGINEPKDIIPGRKMARIISLLVTDSEEHEDDFYTIVKQVTDGKGLNITKLKGLLNTHLPEHNYHFELDRALKWMATLLNPWKPVPPFEVIDETPTHKDPQYIEKFKELLSAKEIYNTILSQEPLSIEFCNKLGGISHYLNLEQVKWILSQNRSDFTSEVYNYLKYLHELKARIKEISENFGGISYAMQPLAISFFLGEITTAEGFYMDEPGSEMVSNGILGPYDIAVLLRSGLSSPWQNRTVQVNQRLIWDYILRQDDFFLRQVLVESAENSSRALAAILFGIMESNQNLMEEPLDFGAILEEKLGIIVPRRRDYMAGGVKARNSYFEDLAKLSDQIIEKTRSYRALKAHIEIEYHEPSGAIDPSEFNDELKTLIETARASIQKADKLGAKCTFSPREKVRQKTAREAYVKAFEACRAVIELRPDAFQLPWMSAFWKRNYEALMILSVVRNYQQDIDNVRYFIAVRTGIDEFKSEQHLLEGVVNALYYYENDRESLLSDPLVKLLIDPEEINYDFSIVSCMGVITEGEKGAELENAYKRIFASRGVEVIRADTQTARSLEFNAEKVQAAVKKISTPWGFIGYSQGCANGLRGESLMYGGTPYQQSLLKNFKGRNLLFSAINGSAHGTCGEEKFLEAMAEGDRFLKYYQAIFSSRFINLFLKNIGIALDSELFIHILGGVYSLSHFGVRHLAGEGQFVTAPTSYIRGVVEESTLPEALEMLSNVLTKQIGTIEHDTQVEIHEAVGHFVWVKSPHGDSLERCDMESMVQRSHHWSPLLKDVEFVTTERDRELAIYDMPKDRHVFPWVDTLGRFGIIKPKHSS